MANDRISFAYNSPKLKKAVEKIAAFRGNSVQSVVRDALSDYVSQHYDSEKLGKL